MTPTPTVTHDYRILALETAHDDLFGVAAQSAVFRDFSKLAIETIVERDRRIESLQRQLQAVKDEFAAHRARVMLADSLKTPEAARPSRTRPTTPAVGSHHLKRTDGTGRHDGAHA
jgi:hypothetical protein